MQKNMVRLESGHFYILFYNIFIYISFIFYILFYFSHLVEPGCAKLWWQKYKIWVKYFVYYKLNMQGLKINKSIFKIVYTGLVSICHVFKVVILFKQTLKGYFFNHCKKKNCKCLMLLVLCLLFNIEENLNLIYPPTPVFQQATTKLPLLCGC